MARQFNMFVALAALLLAAPQAAAQDAAVNILALGDSLTAGYGLPSKDFAWPALLHERLTAKGYNVTVENAGVSGDTSAGGRARLDWTLDGFRPAIAVVALGANDALRGLPPAQMRDNLDAILTALERAGARVLLAGMKAPPNMGRDYAAEFEAVFPALAKKHDAALLPFLLEGVAADPALNQADGIHPNENGAAIMVDHIAPYVVRLIEDLRRKRLPK